MSALRRDAIYRRALILADVLAAAVAVGIGIGLMGDERVSLWIFFALPLIVLVSKAVGLYDRDELLLHKNTLDEIPKLFQVSALYAILVWLGSSVVVHGAVGRDQFLGLWGLFFLATIVARAGARWVALGATTPERCVVVGDAGSAGHLATKLAMGGTLKAELVGRVDMPYGRRSGDPPAVANFPANDERIPVLGTTGDLDKVLLEHHVERAIIAPGSSYSDEMLDLIRLVKAAGVKVSLLPRLFEVVGSSVVFDQVEGVTLLGVRRFGLSRSSSALKRSVDLVGSVVGVTVLAPLFLLVAMAIKLGSPGPAFFKQRRIGRDGRQFDILKFRTMDVGADSRKRELLHLNQAAEGLFKIGEDPRTTRVGRLLRRSSLDELPQLFNVLKGDMSLVGPRPLVIDEDLRIEGWHRRRLQVNPGMTGIWQVLGSSRIPLSEMVKIDYLYAANWSLWLDVKILLRTIPYVFRRRSL